MHMSVGVFKDLSVHIRGALSGVIIVQGYHSSCGHRVATSPTMFCLGVENQFTM